jgi:hypothetical protein
MIHLYESPMLKISCWRVVVKFEFDMKIIIQNRTRHECHSESTHPCKF